MDRSAAVKKANAEKRKAKFQTLEAAKPPEQRLKARTDFDVHVFKQLASATEAAHKDMREWFVEFAVDDNVQ